MKADIAWKALIGKLFPDFVRYFMPQAYQDIDWSHKPAGLDSELPAILKDLDDTPGEHGRFVDKLMQVRLLNGRPLTVFFHIEVQAQVDVLFPERMFVYNYRLYDRHVNPLRKELKSKGHKTQELPAKIFSMAILADPVQSWQPEPYTDGIWGNQLTFKYHTFKLTSLREQLAPLLYKNKLARDASLESAREGETGATTPANELESAMLEVIGDNPFSVFVAAHLNALDFAHDPAMRMRSVLYLLRPLLRSKRFSLETIRATLAAIGGLMELPEEMRNKLKSSVRTELTDEYPEFVNIFEQFVIEDAMEEGLAKGLQQGREEGREEGLAQGRRALIDIILLTLRQRIGLRDVADYEARLQSASLESLQTWAQRCITANGVQDIFEH